MPLLHWLLHMYNCINCALRNIFFIRFMWNYGPNLSKYELLVPSTVTLRLAM